MHTDYCVEFSARYELLNFEADHIPKTLSSNSRELMDEY